MRWGIESYKDIFELLSYSAIIFAFVTYVLTQRQFRFTVMIRCIERFQRMLPELNRLEDVIDEKERQRITSLYIDLCEEELFYFSKGYLPKEVMDEWLEGMLNYLPFFNSDGKLLNEKHTLKVVHNDPLLNGYPRIRKCFGHSRGEPDLYEKKLLDLVAKAKSNLEDV
jgi:hypothetical protein